MPETIQIPDLPQAASSRPLLEFLCGRHTGAMLEALADSPGGKRRYNELHRLLPHAPKKTLTGALRRLESLGVVERRVFAEVPARVEYSLTSLGHTLVEPMRGLALWAQEHPDAMRVVLEASGDP